MARVKDANDKDTWGIDDVDVMDSGVLDDEQDEQVACEEVILGHTFKCCSRRVTASHGGGRRG